jgi:hypothetical protein
MTRFQQKWAVRLSVLPVVIALGVFWHIPRLMGGWGHYLLAVAAGGLGGMVVVFFWDRFRSLWIGTTRSKRILLVAVVAAAQFLWCFARNYGSPDGFIYDILDLCGVALALLLWGSYQIFSRVVDWLWARIPRRY